MCLVGWFLVWFGSVAFFVVTVLFQRMVRSFLSTYPIGFFSEHLIFKKPKTIKTK